MQVVVTAEAHTHGLENLLPSLLGGPLCAAGVGGTAAFQTACSGDPVPGSVAAVISPSFLVLEPVQLPLLQHC